jgi:hypothetical protein
MGSSASRRFRGVARSDVIIVGVYRNGEYDSKRPNKKSMERDRIKRPKNS